MLSNSQVLRPSAASTPHNLPPLPASLADIAKLGGAHDEVLVDVATQTRTSWRASSRKGDRSRKLVAAVGGAELAIWSVRVRKGLLATLCKDTAMARPHVQLGRRRGGDSQSAQTTALTLVRASLHSHNSPLCCSANCEEPGRLCGDMAPTRLCTGSRTPRRNQAYAISWSW